MFNITNPFNLAIKEASRAKMPVKNEAQFKNTIIFLKIDEELNRNVKLLVQEKFAVEAREEAKLIEVENVEAASPLQTDV